MGKLDMVTRLVISPACAACLANFCNWWNEVSNSAACIPSCFPGTCWVLICFYVIYVWFIDSRIEESLGVSNVEASPARSWLLSKQWLALGVTTGQLSRDLLVQA